MLKYLIKVFNGDECIIQLTVSQDNFLSVVRDLSDLGMVKAYILEDEN